MASAPSSHSGRALMVLVAFAALVFGGVFLIAPDRLGDDRLSLTEKFTPRLGLDLEGGTQVILTPRVASGKGEVDSQALARAVGIIRQRVDAFGVAEAEVQPAGSSIVISIPGTHNNEILETVRQTAELRFRPVYHIGGGVAEETPTPSPAGTTSPKTDTKTSPAPKQTTQKRAVPEALRVAASPSPPQPGQDPQAPQGPPPEVTPELLKAFNALDCTDLSKVRTALRTQNLDRANRPLVTCSQDGNEKYILGPAEVLGTDLDEASHELERNQQGQVVGNDWQVSLQFNGAGTKKFANTTRRLSKQQEPLNRFAIVLDGLVVSAPSTEYIPGGQAQITGDFTQKDAKDLANVLKYGALPLAFDPSEELKISPTLGRDQLHAGIAAGVIGMLLVVVYSLLYYRGLGLVAVVSLAVAGVLTWGAISLLGWQIGFRLSLAGVAGTIIGIGVTADSFIVYFERLRDEMREGKTLRVAVETGWVRARRTILAADFVSLLGAIVLYVLSVGGVRGFAFTLGLTTLIDIVVVFLFTKPLVTLLARRKFFGQGHPLSGVDPKHLGLAHRTLTTRPPRRQPAPARRTTTTKEA